MFVRFVLNRRNTSSRVAAGLFCVAYDVRDNPQTPDYLRAELCRQLGWFDAHLDVPTRFAVRSKKKWRSLGVCWFRGEARDYVARGRELAWLLTECGEPTDMLKTRRPGQILYRDAIQVVAKPEDATPSGL